MEPIWPFLEELAFPLFICVGIWGALAVVVSRTLGRTAFSWFALACVSICLGLSAYAFVNAASGDPHPNRYSNVMVAIIATMIGSWGLIGASFLAAFHFSNQSRAGVERNKCPSP